MTVHAAPTHERALAFAKAHGREDLCRQVEGTVVRTGCWVTPYQLSTREAGNGIGLTRAGVDNSLNDSLIGPPGVLRVRELYDRLIRY